MLIWFHSTVRELKHKTKPLKVVPSLFTVRRADSCDNCKAYHMIAALLNHTTVVKLQPWIFISLLPHHSFSSIVVMHNQWSVAIFLIDFLRQMLSSYCKSQVWSHLDNVLSKCDCRRKKIMCVTSQWAALEHMASMHHGAHYMGWGEANE